MHLTLNATITWPSYTFTCPEGKLLKKYSHLCVAYVCHSGTILRPFVGIVLAWPSGVIFGTVWRQHKAPSHTLLQDEWVHVLLTHDHSSWRRMCEGALCWRQTVPKVTPDGQASTMPTEGLRMVPDWWTNWKMSQACSQESNQHVLSNNKATCTHQF